MHPFSGFGENQLAADMLACGFENILENLMDQEIFAFRVISTYVTFYRAEIPTSYWEELSNYLPLRERSVVIKRWPKENSRESGLNLTKPEESKAVTTNLI